MNYPSYPPDPPFPPPYRVLLVGGPLDGVRRSWLHASTLARFVVPESLESRHQRWSQALAASMDKVSLANDRFAYYRLCPLHCDNVIVWVGVYAPYLEADGRHLGQVMRDGWQGTCEDDDRRGVLESELAQLSPKLRQKGMSTHLRVDEVGMFAVERKRPWWRERACKVWAWLEREIPIAW